MNLAVASLESFIVRGLAIALFFYGAYLISKQFNRGKLQPLRVRLWLMVVLVGISNVPIMFLHWQRMFGHPANQNLTSYTTLTNAVAMLITAILTLSIIRFRIKK